mmetsp:Transcript_20240/g.43770  ORF Transcript_20240/g.43770 Transcript_20240/m.43770 type:complete len:288 (+) Transcript_20240:318-1181(+)
MEVFASFRPSNAHNSIIVNIMGKNNNNNGDNRDINHQLTIHSNNPNNLIITRSLSKVAALAWRVILPWPKFLFRRNPRTMTTTTTMTTTRTIILLGLVDRPMNTRTTTKITMNTTKNPRNSNPGNRVTLWPNAICTWNASRVKPWRTKTSASNDTCSNCNAVCTNVNAILLLPSDNARVLPPCHRTRRGKYPCRNSNKNGDECRRNNKHALCRLPLCEEEPPPRRRPSRAPFQHRKNPPWPDVECRPLRPPTTTRQRRHRARQMPFGRQQRTDVMLLLILLLLLPLY